MGDSGFDVASSTRMGSQVMDLYADDYIKTWDGILNDLTVVPLKNLAQASEALGLIGGPTSPLRGLLSTVEANTNLTKPPEGGPTAAALSRARPRR